MKMFIFEENTNDDGKTLQIKHLADHTPIDPYSLTAAWDQTFTPIRATVRMDHVSIQRIQSCLSSLSGVRIKKKS